MGLIPDLTIENQLLPLAKPLGVIDIKNLLRRNAVKFDLEERLVKNPAAGIGKELDHTRILTRVNGHRLGFFQDAVDERDLAFELNPLDLAPVVVVFLNRDRDL